MPRRCHLLIGPPAIGKTSLAQVLAPLVGGVVLSADRIRAELFGDAAVQGPWVSIEAALHQRLAEYVGAGTPVIVEASHARAFCRRLQEPEEAVTIADRIIQMHHHDWIEAFLQQHHGASWGWLD